MLGVKTCRAARTCFAGRAHWRTPSQSVCAPGPARRWGMQGFALWVHENGDGARGVPTFDPQHHGGALLWRHMHMVYYCSQAQPLMQVSQNKYKKKKEKKNEIKPNEIHSNMRAAALWWSRSIVPLRTRDFRYTANFVPCSVSTENRPSHYLASTT